MHGCNLAKAACPWKCYQCLWGPDPDKAAGYLPLFSGACLGTLTLSWQIAQTARIYFFLEVCLETVGVFLLTFTRITHPDI